MRAFHNDPKIKEIYLSRVIAHRLADEIIKGSYWENGKGCAVGCTIHSGYHSSYETELGIPMILARLEDGIFESLPNDMAVTWPERFLDAITPGADLTKVWNKFAYWLLVDPVNGVLRFADTALKIKSINDVAALYLRSLKGVVSAQEWRDAAYSNGKADTTAFAAAYTAYADSSDAACVAYANAAYTAYAACDAAYDRTKARIIQSEKLLGLLKDAK